MTSSGDPSRGERTIRHRARYLTALFEAGTAACPSDHELLGRFADRRGERDEVAEAAFAALVSRHGPMVFRVCRAVIGDRHEGEDAFQATFLVLASRARSIRSGDSVGSWLHGVALRVASRARSRATRRRHHELRHAEMIKNNIEGANVCPSLDRDLARVLQEEIGQLPEKFRTAVVLCYLEGLTHEAAAGHLGCPVGTIRSRLATARERLKRRLTRRGVAPAAPAGWLASALARVSESIPSGLTITGPLAEGTIRAAMHVGLGKGALAGIVSAEAVSLMEGVLTNMMTTKLTLVATQVLVAGLVSAGVGVTAYSALGRDEAAAPAQATGPNLAQSAPQKKDASPLAGQVPLSKQSGAFTITEETRRKLLQRSEEQVKALIREFKEKEEGFAIAYRKAKTDEAQGFGKRPRQLGCLRRRAAATGRTGSRDIPCRGGPDLDRDQSRLWLDGRGAKEMIARDHIRSDKIEPVFRDLLSNMPGSMATERLFREALAKNPNRKIRCLACYHLGRFLDSQATYIRLGRMFDPEQLKAEGRQSEKKAGATTLRKDSTSWTPGPWNERPHHCTNE